jgi:hypothetical protein
MIRRSCFFCLVLGAIVFVFSVCAGIASAQTSPSAKDEGEAEIREVLRAIIANDPDHAAEAQKALDALDKPAFSPEGRQARNRRERGSRRIVNGLPSRAHPAVGALLKGTTPQTAGAWCTGTLVGCDKFLTAAHCIAADPSPSSYLVFFQELGFFQVKAIRWEKEKYDFPYFDLAMLTLAEPVEGIAPMPINMSVRPLNNSVATIVGFGRTGGIRLDYGLKREGTIKTSACPDSLAKSNVLCWHFDADVISGASAQNTCNADSGGGIFMRDGPQRLETVFGVVSGGTDGDCMKNDLSYNVDVFQYRDWITAAGEGRLSSAMCGKPLWAGASHPPVLKTLQLGPSNPEVTFTMEVPEGTSALRVAMNAEDNGRRKNLFQFSVFGSKDQGGSENACKDNGTGQFAFCAIDKPKSGPWTIRLRRAKGEGEVQITTLLVSR